MLDKKQIIGLSVKMQTTELNIAREYLQHRFLSFFYKKEKSSEIYFKGGTALRIVFDSPRFSEDLDFTAGKIKISEIEDLIVDTLGSLSKEGLVGDIRESKKTSGGFLAIIDFQIHNYNLALRIEISAREKGQSIKGEFAQINSALSPAYILWHLATEQLIHEKIQATLTRAKPRDFYDIYFLLRSRLINPSEKSLLKKIPKILGEIDINFSSELKEFLPLSLYPVIKNFKEALLRELK